MNPSLKLVRTTLIIVFVMCLGMVTLGGWVRLSGSGFSIPQWPLFTVSETILPNGELVEEKSVLPPSNVEGWERLRDIFVHHEPTQAGIHVDDFKKLFWVEWSHRGLASLIGLAYLVLMVVIFRSPEARKSIGLLCIAGLLMLFSQVLIGGVVIFLGVAATAVAFHLIAAFFFISIVLWMLLKVMHPPLPEEKRTPNSIVKWAVVIYALICVQIFSGGLMAASKAGYQMTTWPRMGDYWVPPGLQQRGFSIVRNFTENVIMIQFWHRWYAMAVALAILLFVARCMTVRVSRTGRWALRALFATVILQVILGIITLLTGVHPHIALTHQMVGLFVMLISLVTIYETRNHEVVMEMALAEEQERMAAGGKVAERAA
ncbi:COX15/CtaA family protein [Candidatus Sumerlaeota bacterium]|nr:COX15/CtaA family protein [Candidatus Sumerlaeota bacterium]